ncbi:pentatricopeptide repeat-containing protein [Cocos nucifera]|uniref:Pentatricopeptide repeat-containing protein n=1 Tax=Cocos nucifera TaxID=13894 RepID=A0A8K0IRW2_COCNU|nr:pentatricopeptide repeat-containing protein [Cocos nucifera]
MIKAYISLSSNISHFSHFKPKSSHIYVPLTKYCSSLNPAYQPQISNLYRRKDPFTFASALAFSSRINSSILGTQLHAQIIKLGFSKDIFSQNNLVVVYSKCEVLGHALKVFDEMAEKNLVSWTSMISGLVQNNEHDMGLELYIEMMRSGFYPNEFTLASVLSSCALIQAISFGHCIHSITLKLGLDRNPFVGSSLLLMYAKWGNIEAAEFVFECIGYRDLACWNAVVEGYALNGYGYDAMRIVTIMHQKGLIADQYTYISALKGCLTMGNLSFGRQIHCLIIQNEFENNTSVMNSLIVMYFRTGMKDSGVKVFGKTQEKDIVSWNTVISGFVQEEDEKQVVDLFSNMLLSGLKPNQVTLSVIFRLCGAKDDLSLGLQFFCFACHLGYLNDVLVVNSLINMFSKCYVVESAYFLFSNLTTRNLVTWNEMIQGYNLNGYGLEALQLFHSMVELGIEADEFTYLNVLGAFQGNQKTCEQIHTKVIKSGFDSCSFVCSSLINAYSSFGLVGTYFKIFQDFRTVDLVSWGTIISAFLKKGFCSEALSLVNSLRETGQKPDEFILGSAMNACANIALLNQTKCVHSLVIKGGYEKHFCVGSAVIDAYAKCGDINSSKQAFDSVSRDDDAILFNTMISAYSHHGLITDAIELFEKMKCANLCPTHATFVAVISSCSHLGLVEQGQHFFDTISSAYGMYPSRDNFACFVDLLARNGLIEKAKDVIENMPYEPWPAVWRSLLSGCRIYGNKEIGELAAEQILKLMPNNDGAHVLLSNIYAEDGRWEDAEKVRMKMEEKGVQKACGYSIMAT